MPPAGVLTDVYQYNHQAGTLHLPLGEGCAASPVALEVRSAQPSRLCCCGLALMLCFHLLPIISHVQPERFKKGLYSYSDPT